ncbi:iron-dependent peroxidase [Sphingomonas sp. DBB INV C78]|uniref:Dyp-type peroxidase n=1 Tax=Sphingomonas sp. DBB INV C78 TaxID=3349434 RepID=UPI0036D2AAB8
MLKATPGPVRDTVDIQALVRSGFGPLGGACFLLLNVTDKAAARAWLGATRPTSIADLDGGHVARIIQIAISASGLAALGVDVDAAHGFAPEYLQGMTGDPGRSQRLGDQGANAPTHWRWGAAGEPHLLVALYAEQDDLPAFRAEVEAALAPGFTIVTPLETGGTPGREPFGFVDGVSQPTLDWEGNRKPGTSADQDFTNFIASGEVLLGYPDEYGLVPDRPILGDDDLGLNGTYLVLRSLAQDVDGFWNWTKAAAGEAGSQALAEAMVGRRIDGRPLDGLPEVDVPGINQKQLNGFTYDRDGDGHICPFGGHIRRANPRTGDLPGGRRGIINALLGTLGFKGSARDDAIASTRFHRILRRGRAYGDPGGEQGLHFICLNASLGRQFEFVQGAWLANAKFAGLADEADPIVGSREPLPAGGATDHFTRPNAEGPCARFAGLPRFVTVTGGGYFLLPGLNALKLIARAKQG